VVLPAAVERWRPQVAAALVEGWPDHPMPEGGVGWLLAQVHVESSGRPEAVSPAGAVGLLQLMPATAAEVGCADPLDPEANLRGGITYLRRQYERFPESPAGHRGPLPGARELDLDDLVQYPRGSLGYVYAPGHEAPGLHLPRLRRPPQHRGDRLRHHAGPQDPRLPPHPDRFLHDRSRRAGGHRRHRPPVRVSRVHDHRPGSHRPQHAEGGGVGRARPLRAGRLGHGRIQAP
jgi:hypothetical protein